MSGKRGMLDWVERAGNRLPDPTVLFVWCTLAVMALSQMGVWAGWRVQPVRPVMAMETVTDAAGQAVTRPARGADGKQKVELRDEGSPVACRSLLTSDGLYYALSSMVGNFVGFPPLGVVLVAMLGVGVAEKTGLIAAALRAAMLVTPSRLLTPAVVFVGVNSSLSADAGFIVLPPIAAALYKSAGRSPLAGVAAVYAGVAGGFCANVLITSLDPLLSNLTQMGARVLEPGYTVNAACNWYFMAASTVALTLSGWAVTSWLVERRLNKRPASEGGPGEADALTGSREMLTPTERRGVAWAGIGIAAVAGTFAAGALIPGWPLHTPTEATDATGDASEHLRWMASIVPMIFFGFAVPGVIYGRVTGKVRSLEDVVRMMGEAIASMAPMLVMAFVAAQFIAYLKYSNLDRMLAFGLGTELARSGLSPTWLLIAFIGVSMVINVFVGSASAKWAVMAPIFVPIFMLLGFSPALTQAAYRIGDSVTNVITPLNAYLVIVLMVMQRYSPRAGMGTLLSMMLPYCVVFTLVWVGMLLAWMHIGMPLGPGGGLEYMPR